MSPESGKLSYLSESEVAMFNQLHEQLGGATDAAAAAAPNLGDLCRKYHEISSTLQTLLPIIGKIPFIGKKAVAAIQFLMSIAEIACPATGGALTASAAAGSPALQLSLEEVESLNRLDHALGHAGGGSGAMHAEALAFPDKAELCKQYHKVKGLLAIAIPIIGKIPRVGAVIVTVITLLMGIADLVCPL